MSLRQILGVFLGLALTACTTHVDHLVEVGDRYTAQATQVEDYRLGVGDKVRLRVFNEPTLSGEFAVTTAGALSLPLIGDVPAIGLAPEEVAKQVQSKLAEGYLREPRVSIEIMEYRPFFILGEVKAPGQYPYATGLTVLNAVAKAEGFSPRAEKKIAFIRRSGAAAEEAFRLTPDLRLWPGDTVRIGERYF